MFMMVNSLDSSESGSVDRHEPDPAWTLTSLWKVRKKTLSSGQRVKVSFRGLVQGEFIITAGPDLPVHFKTSTTRAAYQEKV